MRISNTAFAAALAIGSFCAIGPVSASDYNPAGIYVGAAIGQSNVRNDGFDSGNRYGFDNRDTAWQLSLGVRPLPVFGVEYDYMNFGSPNGNFGSFYTSGNSNTTANALFAVGYLPLPLPLIDVYGKVGAARLQANNTVVGPSIPINQSFTNTDLAYGVGSQVKFGNFAIRAEYERISDRFGDPDMLSVGANFTF